MISCLKRNKLVGWACLNPRVALAEHRLMIAHRKREPICQACGEANPKRLEVHHIVPLWKNPAQAGTVLNPKDPTNASDRMITLCDSASHNCHLRHGHAGNFAEHYVVNVVITCAAIRIIQVNQEVVDRDRR